MQAIVCLLALCLGQAQTEPAKPPAVPDTAEVRQILAALVETAEANQKAGVRTLRGDALAQHYVRMTAAYAESQRFSPRAFLIALGVGLDHTDLIRKMPLVSLYFGKLETDAERQRRLKALGEPSLLGRRDWLLHYWGSAAVTALLDADTAERIGVAKEVLDAKTPGGSGFSFSDLHADFAGIALARHLLDESKGKERLGALGRRFDAADYVPDLRLLEDSRSWEKFLRDYGGVDDERFTTLCKLIHHRMPQCAGLRDQAKAASLTSPTSPTSPSRPGYETRKDHDPNGIGKFYMGREIAIVMGHQAAGWLERPEREQEEQPSKLVDALQLKPGLVVADIGAGSGYYAFRIAEKVGPKGKVFAVDIQPEMLALIRQRMKARGVTNIEPIKGEESDPKLPAESADLILMVDVYHEFNFPYEMIEAMMKALKPGGRLVFVEFRMEDDAVPIKLVHKMSEKQVMKEMSIHPLRWVGTLDVLPWQHIIIFEKRPAR